MAIIAAAIHFVARVFEFLALGRELVQFGAAALRQDGVAGIAIVGLDGALAVGRLVQAIVAAETARPVLVADVVRISPSNWPSSRGRNCSCRSAARRQSPGGCAGRSDNARDRVVAMLCSACGVVGVGLRQDVNRVGFDEGQPAVNLAKDMARLTASLGDW